MLDVAEASEAWCMPANRTPSARGRNPSLPSWLAPRMPSEPPPPAEDEPEPPRGPTTFADATEAPLEELEGRPSSLIPPPPPAPERDVEGEIGALQADVVEAAAAAADHRKSVLAASERDLVNLAIAIAERVIGRELSLDPSFVAGLAREGIAALTEQDELTVAIAPDLAERVPAEAWARALDRVGPPVVDASLAAARVEVRGKHGRVDASVAARLDAVVRSLAEPET